MKSPHSILLLVTALLIGACATQQPDLRLETTTWVVESIDDVDTIDGASPTMQFMEEGRAAGTTGCNQYFGEWEIEGDEVSIGTIGLTKMACEAPRMDQEDRFVEIVSGRHVIDVQDENVLILRGEAGEMRLVRTANP